MKMHGDLKIFEILKILPISYIVPYITTVSVSKLDFENLIQGKCVEIVIEMAFANQKNDAKLDEFKLNNFSMGNTVHCIFEGSIFAICEVVKSVFEKKDNLIQKEISKNSCTSEFSECVYSDSSYDLNKSSNSDEFNYNKFEKYQDISENFGDSNDFNYSNNFCNAHILKICLQPKRVLNI